MSCTVDPDKPKVGPQKTVYAGQNKVQADPIENPYLFCTHAYNGSGGFMDGGYLVAHPKEDNLEKRIKNLFYKNYVRGVIDSVIVPVFCYDPIRVIEGSGQDLYEKYLDNADNRGNSLQRLNKSFQRFLKLHGVCFCVTDNFSKEELSETHVDNVNERKLPYSYIKTADTLIEEKSKVDRFGKIETITFKERWETIEVDGRGSQCVQIYRTWNKTESYEFYVENGKDKKHGEVKKHNLGVVPVFYMATDIEDAAKLLPDVPATYELCRINHAIFNQDSEQRNLERLCAFPMLTIHTNNEKVSISVGADVALTYGEGIEGTANVPAWISPNKDILTVLKDCSKSNAEALIEAANRLGATAITKGEVKSGAALSYEFLGQNFALKDVARSAEEFEYKCTEMFNLYAGTSIETAVEYPDNYKPNQKDFIELVRLIVELIDSDIFPEVVEKAARLELSLKIANYLGFEVDEEMIRQELSVDLL